MFRKWCVYNTTNMNTQLLLPSSYKYWTSTITSVERIVFHAIDDVEHFFQKISPRTNTNGLIRWLKESSVAEREFYLKESFTQIMKQLIDLRSNFPSGKINYLDAGIGGSLTFNRSQIGSILALSFVNLLPKRDNFPACNMERILRHGYSEKLKCILNYFAMLGDLPLAELSTSVSITRRTLKPRVLYGMVSTEVLKANSQPLTKMTMMPPGVSIEDAEGTLQVDFANMFIGGGVFGRGAVQEEIMFLMQPECLVSLLVCERMAPNEAIIIAGTRRYSTYRGYGRSFAYKSPYTNPMPPKTPTGQYKTCIIAIDAIKGGTQGKSDLLLRELGKAYVGFLVENEQIGFHASTISTGKWGCGFFKGDAVIKLIVQWIAATLAGREVLFFPYDKLDATRLQRVVELLAQKTVGEVYTFLLEAVANFKPPYLSIVLSLLESSQPQPNQTLEVKSD